MNTLDSLSQNRFNRVFLLCVGLGLTPSVLVILACLAALDVTAEALIIIAVNVLIVFGCAYLWFHLKQSGVSIWRRTGYGLTLLFSSLWLGLAILLQPISEDFYKYSALPFFHQLNTVQTSWGYQIDSKDESLYVMRRKVYAGDVSQTMAEAKQDCASSVAHEDAYYCHIVSCDPSLGFDEKRPEIAALRESDCQNADTDEYLYILQYILPVYSC